MRRSLKDTSEKDLKDLLTKNGQRIGAKDTQELINRVADCKMFGACPRCPDCDQAVLRVVYSTKHVHGGQGTWTCPGFYDDDNKYQKCPFTSENMKRVAWKD